MFKDILVHVDGTEEGSRRIDFAVNLAAAHGARLSGIHVSPHPEVPPIYKPSHIAQVREVVEKLDQLDAVAAEQVFREKVKGAPWTVASGHMADLICKASRVTDLLILGQYEWEGPAERHPLSLAEAVVAKCGCPVLVVPAEVSTSPPSRILVAWDGSKEATRALHDAMPLLQAGHDIVEIAFIREGDADDDLGLLRDHLAHHGVKIDALVHMEAEGSTDARLLERIRAGHFDLLVMGAFGHPAWFEFLFGGTTAAALLKAQVPVFLSH